VSWPLVKLENIFDIARGGSPRPIAQFITSAPDGLNWISIKDASNSKKYITKTKLKIRKEGLVNSRLVKPGDFLLTNSMSFGRPYIMKTTGCIHDGWLVLSGDSEKVDQDYFYYLLGSDLLHKKFSSLAAGAVVKNLNISLVKGVEIPLPPLTEQQKIANILDAADSLRQKDQQLIEKYTALSQSLFLDMFGDPVSNPMGWDKKPLKYVGIVRTGNTPARENLEYFGTHIEWIKTTNINTPSMYLTQSEEYLSEEGLKVGRSVNAGSLLVTCIAGSKSVIGNVSIADRKVAFNQQINSFTPHEGNVLFFYSLFKAGKKHIQSFSTDSMKGMINKSKFESIDFIIPPIELQNQFAERILAIEAQKQLALASLEKSAALFNSLLQRAFKGELTT
jgi:type I restriction enzyme S subunit